MLVVAETRRRGRDTGEGAVGTEGARRASVVSTAGPPEPEVPERARRRRYTAEYKLGVLGEADACAEPGQIGALLRREGLYSSLLSQWREQRRAGALNGLTPRKRGRKLRRSAEAKRIEQLESENSRLRKELRQAQLIIGVQKKVARLLGNRIEDDDEDMN